MKRRVDGGVAKQWFSCPPRPALCDTDAEGTLRYRIHLLVHPHPPYGQQQQRILSLTHRMDNSPKLVCRSTTQFLSHRLDNSPKFFVRTFKWSTQGFFHISVLVLLRTPTSPSYLRVVHVSLTSHPLLGERGVQQLVLGLLDLELGRDVAYRLFGLLNTQSGGGQVLLRLGNLDGLWTV